MEWEIKQLFSIIRYFLSLFVMLIDLLIDSFIHY